MAQKRVDVLNKSGGALFTTSKPKVTDKVLDSISNAGLAARQENLASSKSSLNQNIQQLKGVSYRLDRVNSSKIDDVLKKISGSTTAESNVASEKQSMVNKLLEEFKKEQNEVQKSKDDYERASNAYRKYFSDQAKADKAISQKKQPIYTQDDLTMQKDMLQIEKMTGQQKQDLLDVVQFKENNFSSFLDANTPGVIWVPGQGLKSNSLGTKAAEATTRLKESGYTDKQISELAESYSRKLNADSQKALQEGASQLADKNPLLANIARLPAQLYGGTLGTLDYSVEYLQNVLDKDKRYSTMDPNLQGSSLNTISDAIYSTTRKNIEEGKGGKAGGVLYGAATSLADNLLRFYAAGGGVLGSTGTKLMNLGMAGASAFSDTVREASAKGATANQAALKGFSDAASEVLTEFIPLDNLLNLKTSDVKTLSDVLKAAISQAGTEVATEELNFGIGLLTDALILGDKSDARQQLQQLMDSGMDKKEATKQVVSDLLRQAGTLAAETALSSFAQGAIEGGKTAFRNRNQNTTEVSAPQVARPDLEQQSNPIPQKPIENKSALDRAVELLKSGGNVSNSVANSIMQDNNAVSELSGKTGISIEGTNSEKRNLIKEALSQLSQNSTVDSQQQDVYDNENNIGGIVDGLQEHDRTGGSGDLAQGVAGVQRNDANDAGRGREYGKMALDSGIVRVSESVKKAREDRGVQSYDMYNTTSDPASYEQALISGRNSDTENGWCVTPKSAQELSEGNIRTMMNDTKTVGVGVAPDGDIVAVFKNKNGGPKRAMDTAMPMAIENGGDRLDCYGEGLVRVYGDYGFIPVARVEFNPEYANDGWTPEKGTPYIYFMMHNGDSASDVTKKMHTYPKYTKEQLDALPTYGKEDYDAAMQYRNDLIDERNGSAEKANAAVGAADRNFTGLADYDQLLTDDNVQNPRASDVKHEEVPVKDAYGNRVSENAANVINSEIISERDVNNVKKMIAEGLYGHQEQKMEDVQAKVAQDLEGKQLSSAVHSLSKRVASGRISEYDVAEAQILLAHYTTKTGSVAENMASELFVDLSQMATQSGRQLNMFKLFRKLTPQGQYMTVEKNVERYVDSLNNTRSKDKQVKVSIPDELKSEYVAAAKEAAKENATEASINKRDEIERQIYKLAASQIKSTMKEKWDAWRHMSMLGNVKTQSRNFGGSLLFKPYVAAKRIVGAALEKAFKVPTEERTKAIVGLGKEGRELLSLATQDAKTKAAQSLMTGSAKTGDLSRNTIDESRKIFDYTAENDTSKTPKVIKNARETTAKGLEAARTGLSSLMENTDMLFKRWEYADSLASFLKARGYTSGQWKSGNIPQNVMEQARNYAANEAMKATFNDVNALSKNLTDLRRYVKNKNWKFLDFVSEGTVPYLKTPANVAMRAVEYSPANLINATVSAATQVKQGKMSASQCIDQLSSGLVGSAAVALGYALASGVLGIKLVGAQNDEDEERMGHQAYSLEIGNSSYTIDWAAPSNIPLFVGANLHSHIANEDQADVPAFSKFLTAAANTFEPMLELSCLSSLQDVIESGKYAEEGEAIYAVVASITTSYLMQGLPTIASQFDQLGDKTRQKVYATSEDPTMRSVEKLIGKASQKLPGDFYQTEYVDAWGNTDKSNWFESLFSPSYREKIEETAVDQEIKRLNDVQDENVSPSTPSYTFTVDGKQRRLTGEEWSALAKTQGQLAFNLVDQLINSEDYKKLDDVQKVKAIKSVYDYARENARVTTLNDYTEYSQDWMEDISGKEVETILQRSVINASGLNSDKRYETAIELGVDLPQMQEVSAQVKQKLKDTEDPTDYDTYRAVLEAAPDGDAAKWLEIYGMSDTRLEEMAEAKKQGVSNKLFVDYLQVDSGLDKAFKQITTAWKDGETPSLDSLSDAYDAFEALPPIAQKYFQNNVGGRLGAFVDAMDAGVPERTFIDLWKQYYDIGNDENSASKDATNWAAILDKAKSGGKITEKQREILWSDLGYYTQLRQEAKKYYDLTDEGVKPDVAVMVTNLLSGLDKTKDKLNAIANADLTESEKMASAYAYLDDDQDKKLKAITSLGVDLNTFAALYGLYNGESGNGKKARVVAKYVNEYGLSNSYAKLIYDIYAGKK